MELDTVFVRDLRIETIVGIWDWERRMPQTVSIDLEMAADIRTPAGTECIEDCLDYKKVSKRVISLVQQSKFKLVETMAERIAETIQTEFHVPWVRVSVCKPWAVRGSREVGVVIERGNRGST